MKKMDFIVFGSARSGTTALCNIMLATRELFCGIEFFTPNEDHSKLQMPDAFYEKETLSSTRPGQFNNNHRNTLSELRARDPGDILLYGNKLPLYYKRLGGLSTELGHDKSIMTFRNYRSVIESYSMLEALGSGGGWQKGRSGLFAIGDAMIQIKALARFGHGDILTVPQKSLSADWRRTMSFVGEHLMPGMSLTFDSEKMNLIEDHKKKRHMLKRAKLSEGELLGAEMLESTGISDLLDRDEPFHMRKVSSELVQAAKRLPEDHVGYVLELIDKFGSEREDIYLPQWRNNIAGGAEV